MFLDIREDFRFFPFWEGQSVRRMNESLFELLRAVKSGDDPAFVVLCETYGALIESMVASFRRSCPDAELDDLRQEARMALYNGAMKFDLEQTKVTFGLYAKICIRNRLISVRRKHTSQSKLKSKRNTQGLPAAESADRGRHSPVTLPEEMLSLLSPFEKQVFALYANKCSYSEIAHELSRSVKSIDNAIYRIKSKLRKKD